MGAALDAPAAGRAETNPEYAVESTDTFLTSLVRIPVLSTIQLERRRERLPCGSRGARRTRELSDDVSWNR